jgi:hypothetical protein
VNPSKFNKLVTESKSENTIDVSKTEPPALLATQPFEDETKEQTIAAVVADNLVIVILTVPLVTPAEGNEITPKRKLGNATVVPAFPTENFTALVPAVPVKL